MNIIMAVILATSVVLVILAGTTAYQRYLRVGRGEAAWMWLVALVSAAVIFRYYQTGGFGQTFPDRGREDMFALAPIVLLPLVALPFAVKLYLKWIRGNLTEAEKTTSMDGVRAWLSVGNVVSVLLISLCAATGYGFSFFAVFAFALLALLAYPLMNMASRSFHPVEPKRDDLSAERERVLRMLDERKITAEESAELLTALSETLPSHTPTRFQPNPQRRLVLIGSAVLLVSFFLPWFSYNPGQEINRVMGQAQSGFTQVAQPAPNLPLAFPKTASITISAGEIQHGLGWFILLLGVTTAILPYLANTLDAQTQFKVGLISLATGGVILIYLLTQNMRYVSFGILLGLAGYIMEILGTLQERGTAARAVR